jgi:hypothetical protein
MSLQILILSLKIKSTKGCFGPVPGKFLGIVGQDPSDSKSNQLHVETFQFCFHSFETYFVDSSRMIGNSLEVLMNFNQLFPKLNYFICTNRRFFLDIVLDPKFLGPWS